MSAVLLALVTLVPALPSGQPPRVARLGRIPSAQAPRIDGDLNDSCWAKAPAIGELIQLEPVVRERPDQRTVVRILHDPHALYLAIECFDDHPEGIRATQRARDARLDPDDRVEWILDPFLSRRYGYWFQVGAGGSYGDALVGASGFEKSWDTIWDAAARVTAHGWQAEVELPFRSIPFPRGATTWGFNLRRLRRQSNSEYRWTNLQRGGFFFRIAECGLLEGFGAIDTGIGVDFVPFLSFRARRQRSENRRWDYDPDAGGDVFYRLTPSVTASATFLTDFAETEVDERQINLSRFPLFFPEKRDFFLEDSARFSFGPRSRRDRLLPFFSRRIGLDDTGEKVPILAGLKVAGTQGPWEIGFLDVVTGTNRNVRTRRNLGVLRVKHALAEQTTLGVIGTWGRPVASGDSFTFGVDFYHREPEAIGEQDLRVWAFAVGTNGSGTGGEGAVLGLVVRGESTEVNWRAATSWITPDFDPELGFVRRTDVKRYDVSGSWLPRPESGPIRNFRFGAAATAVFDSGNDFTDLELEVTPIGFELHSGDEARLELSREFERVPEDFTLFDGAVTIAEGDYWRTRARLEMESSEGRPISGRLNASFGDFFAGESLELSGRLSWRPSPLLTLGGSYRWTRARLPQRVFIARIWELRADFDFTSRLTLRNLVQFDNESDELGFQSRLRWILRPGSDLFLVVSGSWLETTAGSFVPESQESTVKILHTLRF